MKSTTPRDPALGQGFYSVEEAARLIHAKPRTVQRWLFGYEYKGQTAGVAVRRRSEGLWTPQYGAEEFSQKALGFLDLLELRVVRAFVNAGVPLLVVRHCLARARDLFGDDYPLTSQRFVTDGETVFWDSVATVNGAANRTEKAELLNLRNGQYTFRDIVQPSLFAGIEIGRAHV